MNKKLPVVRTSVTVKFLLSSNFQFLMYSLPFGVIWKYLASKREMPRLPQQVEYVQKDGY